jgi:hypothetical protein
MALSWVYQDVAGFNRFLADNAKDVSATIAPGLPPDKAEELLAAKMMGRWRDGTPVMLSPNQENPPLAVQDFLYGADPAGKLCPVASHIRIVNGRDQPLDSGHSLMFPAGFPRVLRRGSSYGSWLDGTVDDGQDRGILGMFLCANVNQQFYALTRWIAATNFSDAYKDPNGQDPLFASRSVPRASRRFSIPGDNGKVTLKGIPDFIRMQGVAVMLPALATLPAGGIARFRSVPRLPSGGVAGEGIHVVCGKAGDLVAIAVVVGLRTSSIRCASTSPRPQRLALQIRGGPRRNSENIRPTGQLPFTYPRPATIFPACKFSLRPRMRYWDCS